MLLMKKSLLFWLVLFSTTCLVAGKRESILKVYPSLTWIKEVGAKEFPKVKKIYSVAKYGAVGDGKTLNTKAIQAAIDECARNGGGIVTFPAGEYLTGSIFLKNGVNLRVDKNVTLLGSQNLEDYPELLTRVAGIEMVWPAGLINVMNASKAAVTGKGTVHAQGKPFWDKYWTMRKDYEARGLRWIVDYDCKRPRTLVVANSENVTISGLTFKQSGFWTIQLLYSNKCTVHGVTILNNVDGHGPSTDGVDIDSSSRILVENSYIDCNDDNFCLKSGRDADGLRVNRPTEYVVIRNCVSGAGGGLFTCGSETSGGIRNIAAYNLKAAGTGVGLRLKSAMTRGGVTENIYIHNVEMADVGTAIETSLNWNPTYSYSTLPAEYEGKEIPCHWKVMLEKVEPESLGVPTFRNVYMSNIHASNAKQALVAAGANNSLLTNFHFRDIEIHTNKPGSIVYAKDWEITNFVFSDTTRIKLEKCENVVFE